MGHESREVWEKRVARWRDSGLSSREFAAEVGVNARTLAYWAWRLGQSKRPHAATGAPARRPRRQASSSPKASETPVTWLEVVTDDRAEAGPTPAAPSSLFELVLCGGRTIRVPPGFDAGSLRRLITIAEAR
jgi:hypothetical protein